MFKKKNESKEKAPASKILKIGRWIAIGLIGFIAMGAIFGGDGGGGYKYAEDGSAAQKYFIELQKRTKSSFESGDTDAKKKLAWIKASRELCASSEFDAFGLQKDWLGKVKEVTASDEMSVTYVIQIDGNRTRIRESASQQRWTELGLFTKLLDLKEGDMVRFSGSFRPGDMEGDNECLDEASLGDDPEFSGQQLLFNLARIEKL